MKTRLSNAGGERVRFDNRYGTEHKDEWLTPPGLLSRLGEFDLDPCAPVNRPWPTAKHHYTIEDDGLRQEWFGRVWLNPPYGSQTGRWLKRLVRHGNGIALILARTETRFFFESVWGGANAVLFLRGRLNFYHVTGAPGGANAGAPSCLVAYGDNNVTALERSGLAGQLVRLNPAASARGIQPGLWNAKG